MQIKTPFFVGLINNKKQECFSALCHATFVFVISWGFGHRTYVSNETSFGMMFR